MKLGFADTRDALLNQLKVGARLVAFVGCRPVMVAQRVTRISETEFHTVNLFDTYVAPLVHAVEPPRFRF
jgi:protein-L-isoaspartate(D-aspartate) O-methyltransferase